MASFCASAL